MAKSYTINYNLIKDDANEYYDVGVQSNNMNLIDAALTPTADPSQVPSGNVGKLAQWVSWLTNRIKAITGGANWYDAPAISLAAAANLISIRPTMTIADLTYYVNTATGNDSNNGTSAGTAFKTIQKAIDVIPQVISHTVTVNVAAGTYNEDVVIRGFVGKGTFFLYGDTVISSTYNVKSISVNNCAAYVAIRGFNITGVTASNYGMYFSRTLWFAVSYCNIIAAAPTAHGLFALASFGVVVSSVISNKLAAISNNSAIVQSESNTGNANTYGLLSTRGGIIAKVNATQPTGTTPEYKQEGGLIVDSSGIPTGVLPLTGGTLSGDFTISKANPQMIVSDTGTGKSSRLYQYMSSLILRNNIDSNNRSDLIIDDVSSALAIRLRLETYVAGVPTVYKVYGEHNITISTSAPGTLAEGAQHQVY